MQHDHPDRASPTPDPTTNHDGGDYVLRRLGQPSPAIADTTARPAAGRPEQEERRARRGLGYRIAAWRTRRGPRFGTPEEVLASSAAEGRLAGRTPNAQPQDPGLKAAQVRGIARLRAARRARDRTREAEPDLCDHDAAEKAVATADAQLAALDPEIARFDDRVEQLEQDVVAQQRIQPPPVTPPIPDDEELEEMAADEVPGYRVSFRLKASLYAAAAWVEAVFTSAYIVGEASIGVAGVPVEISIALPWAAGAVVGAILPVAAERAAHAAALAEPDAAWYVRRGPALTIAVPAVLGIGRAVSMTTDDPLSGVLGIGIALMLMALSVVSAAIGNREAQGEKHDARRRARTRAREERRRLLTPPPSAEAETLVELRSQLKDARAQRDGLRAERAKLRTERAEALEASARAKAKLRLVEVASDNDADEENGLAATSAATYVQERDAATAATVGRRPAAFDGASVWATHSGDLPRVRFDALGERPTGETRNDDGEGER